MPDNWVPLSLGVLATGAAWFFAFKRKSNTNRNVQAILSEINVYPIKSCRGLSVKSWEIDNYGLRYDRNWMIIDAKTSRFVTQRQIPKLALVQPSFQEDFAYLCLQAPEMEPLQISISDSGSKLKRNAFVWGDECPDCIDEGDAAGEWITRYVRMHKGADEDMEFRLIRIPKTHARKTEQKYQVQTTNNLVSFADGFPFLLISGASLDELNRRITSTQNAPVVMKQFRPNFVVNGEGMYPFVEDKWKQISIGNVLFYVLKPCTRCKLTTVNPETGIFAGPEPLNALHSFREGLLEGAKEVCFGQNLSHMGIGIVNVEDKIMIKCWK